MERFRSRATAAEIREFQQLASADDPISQTRATEHVLFKLTADELFKIGITQVEQPRSIDWGVACSSDRGDVRNAIHHELSLAGVWAFVSCDLGCAGWYVPREQFFRAREALIHSPSVLARGAQVVTPKFSLR
jgi:hypothetical protein